MITSGVTGSTALQSLKVQPIPFGVAKMVLKKQHYLHSLPGGTQLTLGVFLNQHLMGAIALGAGPAQGYSLVQGATTADCLTLTRLWLSDDLPANAESRVIGICLKALKRFTHLKCLVSYADPQQEHVGTIYQATNWLYTGLSDPTPLYDLGDGHPIHSRTLSYTHGTHSIKYFKEKGVNVRMVSQSAKHRYIYFLDPTWQSRLRVPILPYPKKENRHASSGDLSK
jgi:hypothetical protein